MPTLTDTSKPDVQPSHDCPLCPRLAAFRHSLRKRYDDWFNGPVPSFGEKAETRLLIVGLAPGLKGANRTGRPFTGDYAGDLLYPTLLKFGLAEGEYRRRRDDGLALKGCRITNAVRCVPPQNKPTPEEIRTCNQFLIGEIGTLPSLKVILALGRVAHDATLTALNLRKSAWPFGHHRFHELPNGLILADTYHSSLRNTSSGRLTTAMFEAVFNDIKGLLESSPAVKL